MNDLDAINNNDIVNQVCIVASVHCFNEVESQYINTSGRNYYDIAAIDPDPFSSFYYIDFLAQHWIQAAFDVLISYIQFINDVYNAFQSIDDYVSIDIRSGRLTDLAYLLDNDVKVAFMYGDLDYALGARKSPSQ